jgi:hypothetical protein
MYSSAQLLTSLLQFFAMDAEEQLEYAKGIPLTLTDRGFPFGLDHSPLIEMATATNNIASIFAAEQNASRDAVEALEEFEAVVELIRTQRLDEVLSWTADALRSSVNWRVVRKLSRICLRELGIPQSQPAIAYEELVPYVMD